ncbi:MAG TPA: ABC transporter permease, partial [Streptosporangiaceae bacterium]
PTKAGAPTEPRAPTEAGPATVTEAAPGEDDHPRLTLSRAVLDAIIHGNSVVVTVLAIVAAMVIGGLLIAFTDPVVLTAWGRLFSAPGSAIAAAWHSVTAAYSNMFEGAILNPHTVSAAFHGGSVAAVFNPLSETAVNATPLIFAGLSVALAFRAGLFNIGGTGQFIGGALFATWLGFGVHLPVVIHAVVVLLGAFAGGAVLGWVVGALKAWTGAHEVIVTIMLNYVMIYLLSWLLGTKAMQRPGRNDLISPFIDPNAQLPHIAGPNLRLNASFLIALAAAAGVWWLLGRSTLGFEFRTVGANPRAARSAGMNVAQTWIVVMLIAGGLAGLAASAVIQGTDHSLNFQSYGTYGIDAITVALLGRARPLGTVLAALLFGALDAGGIAMQGVTQIPVDIVKVIQALIVLFIAAPPLVRAMFRLREARAAGEGQVLAKGWNG